MSPTAVDSSKRKDGGRSDKKGREIGGGLGAGRLAAEAAQHGGIVVVKL